MIEYVFASSVSPQKWNACLSSSIPKFIHQLSRIRKGWRGDDEGKKEKRCCCCEWGSQLCYAKSTLRTSFSPLPSIWMREFITGREKCCKVVSTDLFLQNPCRRKSNYQEGVFLTQSFHSSSHGERCVTCFFHEGELLMNCNDWWSFGESKMQLFHTELPLLFWSLSTSHTLGEERKHDVA